MARRCADRAASWAVRGERLVLGNNRTCYNWFSVSRHTYQDTFWLTINLDIAKTLRGGRQGAAAFGNHNPLFVTRKAGAFITLFQGERARAFYVLAIQIEFKDVNAILPVIVRVNR